MMSRIRATRSQTWRVVSGLRQCVCVRSPSLRPWRRRCTTGSWIRSSFLMRTCPQWLVVPLSSLASAPLRHVWHRRENWCRRSLRFGHHDTIATILGVFRALRTTGAAARNSFQSPDQASHHRPSWRPGALPEMVTIRPECGADVSRQIELLTSVTRVCGMSGVTAGARSRSSSGLRQVGEG